MRMKIRMHHASILCNSCSSRNLYRIGLRATNAKGIPMQSPEGCSSLLVACRCPLQTARDCLQLLYTLVNAWLVLLKQQELLLGLSNAGSVLVHGHASGGSEGPGASLPSFDPSHYLDAPTSANVAAAAAGGTFKGSGSFGTGLGYGGAGGLDLHRLEGVMFMLLCSNDHLLRRDAFFLLRLLRQLHQELCKASSMEPAATAAGGSSTSRAAAVAANSLRKRLLSSGDAAARSAAAGLGSGGASGRVGVLDGAGGSIAAANGGTSQGVGISGGGGSGASSLNATGGAGTGGGLEGLLAIAGNVADSAASSSSLVSGIGFFSRHRPTLSRESVDFLPSFGRSRLGDDPCCITVLPSPSPLPPYVPFEVVQTSTASLG